MSQSLRVIVVDDDPEIRAGLRGLIESLGALVVGEAENGRSGIEQARRLRPELILMDVTMPVMGGFAAARELRHIMPQLAIIFVSQHNDRIYAEEALSIGASAYVVKHNAGIDLPRAFDAVISGHTFVSPGAAPPTSGRIFFEG
jgi:DNA-binding NarL/FixJ family response regulator